MRWEFLAPDVVRLRHADCVIYLSPEGSPINLSIARRIKEWESAPVNSLCSQILMKNYINVFEIPASLLRHIPFVQPAHFLSIVGGSGERPILDVMVLGNVPVIGFHGAECALKSIAVFRKRAREWVTTNRNEGRDLAASCFWLPVLGRSESVGLADYLFRFRRSRIDYLRVVAACWPRIARESRRLSPPRLFESCMPLVLKEYAARHAGLAKQAYLAGVEPAKYAAIEERWLLSLGAPQDIPDVGRMSLGNYVARMLRRDDPRGIFLGALTNCCQYPGSAAESSAWHGQEDQSGGFLVVEDHRERVIAQSWIWLRNNILCVDSVESLGLEGERLAAVSRLYSMFVEAQARRGIAVISGSTDLTAKVLPNGRPVESMTVPPDDTYSDAKEAQLAIAQSDPEGIASPSAEL